MAVDLAPFLDRVMQVDPISVDPAIPPPSTPVSDPLVTIQPYPYPQPTPSVAQPAPTFDQTRRARAASRRFNRRQLRQSMNRPLPQAPHLSVQRGVSYTPRAIFGGTPGHSALSAFKGF